VRAAQGAGIYCVAVPNPVTAQLDLSHADPRLASFEAALRRKPRRNPADRLS
jgi:hypothetical protein